MSWKEPSERHNDAVVEAIHDASRHIATAIREGFAHMADAQTKALADLDAAILSIGNAISAEIAALQEALSNSGQPDDSGQIEASVSKLNDLAAALKASIPQKAAPVVTTLSPTSGPAAGGTSISISGSGLTGTTSVTVGGADATGVTVASDTTVTAVTPPGTGSAPVVVTTPAGKSDGSQSFSFI